MTPIEHYPDLAKAIGVPDLYFKREDLHKYGSHKGRSIPIMIDSYKDSGDRKFAISSSGNAALAAAMYIKELNAKENNDSDNFLYLDIFVGNHINVNKESKLQKYADEHIRILKKERPLQALNEAIHEGMRSLRQSTDDTALVGYKSLGEELDQLKNIGAIFIGTSSGTTAQALASYFIDKKNKHSDKKEPNTIPQIHIVQSSSCHPISDGLNNYDGPDEKSEADAITDITALRKSVLIPLIQKTNGSAWFATNEDIRTAKTLVKKYANLDISNNSALSVVGAMQAIYAGHEIEGAVVCMICGE